MTAMGGAGARQEITKTIPFIKHIYTVGVYQGPGVCARRKNWNVDDRDHQTIRTRKGLHRLARKMGGRENLGLD